MLIVKQANFLASIQDDGRNARSFGFTSGGAMDKESFRIANQLVNNPENTAVIEITYGAFAIEVSQDCWVGLAGADLNATLNNEPMKPWQNYALQAGDQLKFINPNYGLRAYLAVQGGMVMPDFMGSHSAVIREGLPGLCGRALSRGDEMLISPNVSSAQVLCKRHYVSWHLPTWVHQLNNSDEKIDIAFYPTYQWQTFTDKEQERFLASTYTIQPSSNRMGYRLSGTSVDYSGAGLVSEGIVAGSIQVPPDGQPIVLMRDHPSVGGYPKLGVVTENGLNQLAQLSASALIGFIPEPLVR